MTRSAAPLPQPIQFGEPLVEAFLDRLAGAISSMDLAPVQPELETLQIRIETIQWNPDPNRLPSPVLQKMWRFWREQHREGSPLPLTDLRSGDGLPAEIAPHCMLLEPANPTGDDFRYRHYGSAVVAAVGKDWTGKCLSEMIRTSTAGLFYLAGYRAVAAMDLPVFSVNISAPRLNATFWNRLVLPWRENGRVSGFLVGDIPSQRAPGSTISYPDIHREESAYLYSLLAESPLGVGIFVNREEFVFCNAALAGSLGTTTAELVRRRPAQLFRDPAVFHRQMRDLHQEIPVLQRESELLADNGDTLWATVSYKRIQFSGLDAVLLWVVDITQRRQLEEHLRRMATVDDLTGISNRRHFFEQAGQELERARRYGFACAVAVVDVDHFKAINDHHGHASGDRVLKAMAAAMAQNLRHGDLLGRLGGEEFGVLLSHAGMAGALEVMERMRQCVAALRVSIGDQQVSLTVSAGLAPCRVPPDTLETSLVAADQALYRAKAGGRNRVCVYEGDPC